MRIRRPSASSLAGAATVACVAAGVAWRRHRAAVRLAGQTVVITGGSRGLGFALTKEFLARGAHVWLLARDEDELTRARDRLRAVSPRVDVVPCDVRNAQSVLMAVSAIVDRTGRIDVLVNNAGVMQVAPFAHTRLEDFDDSLRTHFWGPLYMTRAVWPYMRRQGGGRVLNVASIGGRMAVPHLLPYCAGKFALVGLSEGLRAELAADGITVTTATPGLMRTGSHRNAWVRGQHEREAAWFALASATSLTSMSARRAAHQLVDACVRGRASVTPGWQARAATWAHTMAPGLTAAVLTGVASYVLPSGRHAAATDDGRLSRDLRLGWVARTLPTRAAVRLNQRVAADEAGR
jgi:NAD(P)-dependent dehydrogenase (short-subunit alcohol dehydrogenase family)